MKTTDFDFSLPKELIAQYPLPQRTASKLLCLNASNGTIEHHIFNELPELLRPNDLLVFNDTRVMAARLFGIKGKSGGKIEALVERILDAKRILAHIRPAKRLKIGDQLFLESRAEVEVLSRKDDLFELRLINAKSTALQLLDEIGHIPLPPYITRDAEIIDVERYQTVYARQVGAVAAPTAGLHFDSDLMQSIEQRGCKVAYITLHVGAGTFQPVRVDNIAEHKMHSEYIEVSGAVSKAIAEAKKRGGRVIAVGTTSVRALETAALRGGGIVKEFSGETDIFIYPGYQFQCVDAMITNFHLPQSTLLMLVCAFAGRDNIMHAYHEAIEQRYRFFSYGDAMMIYSGSIY